MNDDPHRELAAATPGTPEFRSALLHTMARDQRFEAYGTPSIVSEEWVSMRTILYRCRIGSMRLIAKAQPTRSSRFVEAEFHELREMRDTLSTSGIRSLEPVAVYPGLGVLVTKEEPGQTLTALLRFACDEHTMESTRAEAALRASARALRLYHDSYAPRDAAPNMVRCYRDFNPGNVLLAFDGPGDEPVVVLIDPPKKEVWSHPADDIGVFCFYLSKLCFRPRSVFKRSIFERVIHFKTLFISQYYDGDNSVDYDSVMPHIMDAEHHRALQTLAWYRQFRKYRSVSAALLRYAFLWPVITRYVATGLGQSYERVRLQLDQSHRDSD